MDVYSAASIMSWEDSSKLGDAFRVGVLQATEHSVVGVGGVVGAYTIAIGDNTAVDTGTVAIYEELLN